MVKVVAVCSGKGGVGKTTVAANLGMALQKLGRRVAVIDCNLTTSHLSLSFGMYTYPRTLNDFLRSNARIEDVSFTHQSGMKVVPASLDLNDLAGIDTDGLKGKIKDAFKDFDVVLLDSAPGLGKEALVALGAADNVLFVANPFLPSLVDILKCHQFIRENGNKTPPIGVVLNRVRGRKYEVTMSDLGNFVELPVVGSIPEDESVLESTNMKTLVAHSRPYAPSSVEIFAVASRLTGLPYKKPNKLKILIEKFKKPKPDKQHSRSVGYTYGII